LGGGVGIFSPQLRNGLAGWRGGTGAGVAFLVLLEWGFACGVRVAAGRPGPGALHDEAVAATGSRSLFNSKKIDDAERCREGASRPAGIASSHQRACRKRPPQSVGGYAVKRL